MAGEQGRVPQAWQVPPGADEGLLGSVLGQLEVPDHGVRVPHGHVLKPAHESGEGLVISCLGTHDQVRNCR